jgi:uncharacterized RDD family membrane protein YckC
MKCPKCGYLGFEEVDRCRNCGYDFSLASGPLVPELALHPNRSDVGILDDLNFVSENPPPQGATAADLPLFGGSAAEDQPLITKVSPPRPPLAVRRATPEVPRVRAAARSSLDLALETEPIATASMTRRRTGNLGSPDALSHRTEATTDDASLSARFVAMALDALILLGIDVLVVYLTLQFCGLTLREIDVLPKIPMLAFLFVQNMGYLTAFTVGGQTLGKMAVGIRVVAADAAEPLDLGRSIRRSLLWVALALPAGLGFLTALLTRDHRGLHDRLAGTRVVRASA